MTNQIRLIVLIAHGALAQKAESLFQKQSVPLLYRANGKGSATSEMIDILGLGDSKREILVAIETKEKAHELLEKMKHRLVLKRIDSGIAFTIPVNALSNRALQVMQKENTERKETIMNSKHALILTIINQGYSEDVAKHARNAGATGGTVIHCRRVSDEPLLNYWGFSSQEDKEIMAIVCEEEDKSGIMNAISKNCGLHSEANGIVLSLPIDEVTGISKEIHD